MYISYNYPIVNLWEFNLPRFAQLSDAVRNLTLAKVGLRFCLDREDLQLPYPLVMTNIAIEKSPFSMGKFTISMAIFHSDVCLPGGLYMGIA